MTFNPSQKLLDRLHSASELLQFILIYILLGGGSLIYLLWAVYWALFRDK